MEISRKNFLVGVAALSGAAYAAEEKIKYDGGLAEVSWAKEPKRTSPLVPPGAVSFKNFETRCVGCQLCVKACPNGVLRPSKSGGRVLLPEMSFERGWCRPECTKCGEVCPTGAILPITTKRKANIHIGHAHCNLENCLAIREGINCNVCARHCPAGAIARIEVPWTGDHLTQQHPPSSPKPDATQAVVTKDSAASQMHTASKPNSSRKKSVLVPVIDSMRCIGCGACEHLCPARPFTAMTLKGFSTHRETVPMGEADLLAEARKMLAGKMAVVYAKNGILIGGAKGKGLAPLMQLHDRYPLDFNGSFVIDKVVGRAAAAICIDGKVARVHAELMSRGAQKLLKDHNIPFACEQGCDEILNNDKTGLCPMEQAVQNLSDPAEMVKTLRAKIEELGKHTNQKPKH